MYIEKAKEEEFDEYYAIKCEDFNLYWTAGNYNKPPRENLLSFFNKCLLFKGDEYKRKEIYFIKDDNGVIAGYLYLDINGDVLDIPIALKKSFTGKGYAEKAVKEGMKIAKKIGLKTAEGKIREDNIASMKLYIDKCGWVRCEDYDEFYCEELKKYIKMYKVRCNL